MHCFDIKPFEGALPLTFGLPIAAVHEQLGTPELVSQIWDKSGHTHYWLESAVNIGFNNTGALMHFGFAPGPYRLQLDGVPVWDHDLHDDPNPKLLKLDPSPIEYVGFLIFLELGVTTTGYHDGDDSQRALTAFRRGDYDDAVPKSSQPDLSLYG